MQTGVKPKKKLSRPALFLLSAAIGFAVPVLAAAGMFISFGSQYGRAETSIDSKDFQTAQECLTKLPAFYRDSPKLIVYAQAGAALEAKQFYQAKEYYASLGDFRDSAALAEEADYRKALSLLDSSDFDGAKQLFSALAQDHYKDSAVMAAQEAEYRHADWMYGRKDYQGALDAYRLLGAYKESADKYKGIVDGLFADAVKAYRTGDYNGAKSQFSFLLAYSPDTENYLTLIDAHAISEYDGYHSYYKTRDIFRKLMTLGDFGDAAKMASSGPFLLYRLEGTWNTSSGKYGVDFSYDTSEGAWTFLYNHYKVDGVSIKAQGSSLYVYYNYAWREVYRFEFVAENTVNVSYLDDGTSETLYRK